MKISRNFDIELRWRARPPDCFARVEHMICFYSRRSVKTFPTYEKNRLVLQSKIRKILILTLGK